MDYPAPSPRYLGPPDKFSDGDNKPIKRIVIHSTVSPCVPGGAEDIAAYFRSDAARGSAHYVVDPENTVQAAYDSVICWHAPPNAGSIGIEMCDYPGAVPDIPRNTAKWRTLHKSWRWRKENQRKMLRRTAKLTAQLCLAYDIPIRWIGVYQLKLSGRGITSHNNVSKAFAQSSHWDPGWWPRAWFMRMVKEEAKKIRSNR